MSSNESALFERDVQIMSGYERFLLELGVASWKQIPIDQREQYRKRLQGIGYMIKGNGDIEPIHNSASF